MLSKRPIAVEFEGAIMDCYSDAPVMGAIEWLHFQVVTGRTVFLVSDDCSSWLGRRRIRRWLKRHAGHAWNHRTRTAPSGMSRVVRGLREVRIKRTIPANAAYVGTRAYPVVAGGDLPQIGISAI